MKTYENFQLVGNEVARQLFQNDKDSFLQNIRTTVKESLTRIHDEQKPECSIRFSAPIPAHNIIRDSILGSMDAEKSDILRCVATPDKDNSIVTKKLSFYDASNEVKFKQLCIHILRSQIRTKHLFRVYTYRWKTLKIEMVFMEFSRVQKRMLEPREIFCILAVYVAKNVLLRFLVC